MDLLLDADVRRPEADALVQSLRRVFNPRRLPAGITVRVMKRPVPGFEPRIAWLDIELPKGRRILVEREEKGRFSSRVTNQPPPAPVQPRAVADAAAADPAGDDPAASAEPAAAEALPPSATRVTVRSGDTLMAILRRQGIDRVEADRAIQAARDLFNLRRLRIGQEITLVTGTDETGADTLKAIALRVGDKPLRQGFPRCRQPLRSRAGGPARVRGGPARTERRGEHHAGCRAAPRPVGRRGPRARDERRLRRRRCTAHGRPPGARAPGRGGPPQRSRQRRRQWHRQRRRHRHSRRHRRRCPRTRRRTCAQDGGHRQGRHPVGGVDAGGRHARGDGGGNRRLPQGSQSTPPAGRPDALPRIRSDRRVQRCRTSGLARPRRGGGSRCRGDARR